MSKNISFSIYKLEDKNIKKIYNEFHKMKKYTYFENNKIYHYSVEEKTNLLEWDYENKKYLYFTLDLIIERPTRERNRKSEKESKVFFFQNNNNEIFFVPILNEVNLYIIARSILKNYIYKFYQPIDDFFKSLLFSWIYSSCKSNVLNNVLDNVFNLKNVKSYKCSSEDKKSIFKGTTEASIIEAAELKQAIIANKDLKNLKLSIEYRQTRCDFTLSFSEEENYKLTYLEKNLKSNLFFTKLSDEEMLILIVDVFISKLKTEFESSKWSNKEHKKCQLELIEEMQTELSVRKEWISSEEQDENLYLDDLNIEKKKRMQDPSLFSI